MQKFSVVRTWRRDELVNRIRRFPALGKASRKSVYAQVIISEKGERKKARKTRENMMYNDRDSVDLYSLITIGDGYSSSRETWRGDIIFRGIAS